MEEYVLPIGIALFVGLIGSLTYIVHSKKDDIVVWYIKLLNEWNQEDHIEAFGKELQLALCTHQFTRVLDRTEDQTHATKREEARLAGKSYFYHLYQSDELAWIQGHNLPFDNVFVKKILEQFCQERWLLIQALFLAVDKKALLNVRCLITSLLYQIKQPHTIEKQPEQQEDV